MNDIVYRIKYLDGQSLHGEDDREDIMMEH